MWLLKHLSLLFSDVTTEKKCAKAELGANFIHGIERNPIFKIADTHGLIQLREAKSLKSKTVYRTEEGEEVGDILTNLKH